MSDADRPTALAEALLAGARRAGAEERDDRERRDVDTVVEIGIGERTAIAEAIADRGIAVLATDVVARSVPESVAFEVDDLHEPDRSRYADADLLYALRLPPELHDVFAGLAAAVDVPASFTTLGGDPPTISTRPEQLPVGETIHWVDRDRGAADAGPSERRRRDE